MRVAFIGRAAMRRKVLLCGSRLGDAVFVIARGAIRFTVISDSIRRRELLGLTVGTIIAVLRDDASSSHAEARGTQ